MTMITENPLSSTCSEAVMRADVMALAKEEEIRLIIQTQRHCLLGTFTGVVNFLFSRNSDRDSLLHGIFDTIN